MAALAHTLNSRGELGMFVNPHDCSCTTCHDYLADRESENPIAVTYAPPPPLSLQEEIALIEEKLQFRMTLGQEADWERLLISRKAALQKDELSAAHSLLTLNRILVPDTQFETPPRSSSVARTLSFSPPPVLRSMTGFHYTPSPREDTGTLPASPPSVPEEIVLQPAQAKIIYDGLTDYIQMLRIQQDKVYDTPTRSHDEMAAQDMEFEELDRKIAEMDDILQVLQTE